MTSLPPSPPGDLVATLRAAGCVFAEDEARLLLEQATDAAQLGDLVRRRVAGEPLEQVLGWAEFHGLRVRLEPGVFVPRRRTELLVDAAVARRARRRTARLPVVVGPLLRVGGCGGRRRRRAAPGRSTCTPRTSTPAAVACAGGNLAGLAQVHRGRPVRRRCPPRLRGELDVVVACTPYVPTGEVRLMPPEARDHEPLAALDGGPDGLDVVRRLLADAVGWLRAEGFVAVETSERQAPVAAEAFARAGLVAAVVSDDALGATVVTGRSVHRR